MTTAWLVVASPLERGDMIVGAIRALEEEHGVSVEIDEDLLNEVLNLQNIQLPNT